MTGVARRGAAADRVSVPRLEVAEQQRALLVDRAGHGDHCSPPSLDHREVFARCRASSTAIWFGARLDGERGRRSGGVSVVATHRSPCWCAVSGGGRRDGWCRCGCSTDPNIRRSVPRPPTGGGTADAHRTIVPPGLTSGVTYPAPAGLVCTPERSRREVVHGDDHHRFVGFQHRRRVHGPARTASPGSGPASLIAACFVIGAGLPGAGRESWRVELDVRGRARRRGRDLRGHRPLRCWASD